MSVSDILRLARRGSAGRLGVLETERGRIVFDRLIDAENASKDPRPSRVFLALRSKFRHDSGVTTWLEQHRGSVLAEARRHLRNQPPTPMKPYVATDAEREQGFRCLLSTEELSRRVGRGASRSSGRSALVLAALRQGKLDLQRDTAPVGRPLVAEGFAGAGLLGLALSVEGGFTVDGCERDRAALATQRANGHGQNLSACDARTWTPSKPYGNLDLLTGGPPCTDFTRARALAQSAVPSTEESEKNMYPRVLDWIADTQPRVVMLENSGAVATSRAAVGRRSRTISAPGELPGPGRGRAKDIYYFFEMWWDQLSELGYEGLFYLMYAPDFGTPQHRMRAWVVAYPKGAPWGKRLRSLPAVTHAYPRSLAVRRGEKLPWVSAFDRLHSGCCQGFGLEDCVNLNNHLGQCWTCEIGSNYEQAPNSAGDQGRRGVSASVARRAAGRWGTSKRLRLLQIPFVDLSYATAFGPVAPDSPGPLRQVRANMRVTDWVSRAMVANALKDDLQIMVAEPGIPSELYENRYSDDESKRHAFTSRLRRLSVRDMAKLQDVPQWWGFSGRTKEVMRQIGNGVPINMGRSLGRHVFDALRFDTDVGLGGAPLSGLWPMTMLDACQQFNMTTSPAVRSVTAQARRKRPFASAAEHMRQSRVGRIIRARLGHRGQSGGSDVG